MSTNVVQWSNFDDQVRYQPISGIIPVQLWTPSELTTDDLWLDANDASTITEVTGVSNWADKSTVGTNDWSQGTGTKQPIYSSVNKTITWDGTDDELNGPALGLTDGAMALIVFEPNSDTSFTMLDRQSGSTNVDRFTDGKTYPQQFRNTRIEALSLGMPSSGGHIYSMMADSTAPDYRLRIDGAATYTNTGAFTFNASINRMGGSFVFPYAGIIREVVIVNEFDLTIMQKLEGYSAWKWDGINSNTVQVDALDASHPYKSAAPTV